MATIQINGVKTEVPSGAIAYKYADPTEGARWVYDESDLADISREDPSLLVHAYDWCPHCGEHHAADKGTPGYSCA